MKPTTLEIDRRIAEWRSQDVDLHDLVQRWGDDERVPWGEAPESEAIEVAALGKLLELEPWRATRADSMGNRLFHAVVEEMAYVDPDNEEDGTRALRSIFEACFAAGADPNAANDSGATPLFFASTPLAIELLVAAGADPNATTATGATPLMYAVRCPELVAELLISGADHRRRDKAGRCARDWALHYGAHDTLRILDELA
jgi:ankyrin repeat protein